MITKDILKKTIPIIAFISQSCSSNLPEPIDKLKKYNSENKIIYQNFMELLENKKYLMSKDKKTCTWKDSEKNCMMVKKFIDKQLTVTFRDYGFDGLMRNDEYSENFSTKYLGNFGLGTQLSMAKSYAWEIEKLIKENQK